VALVAEGELDQGQLFKVSLFHYNAAPLYSLYEQVDYLYYQIQANKEAPWTDPGRPRQHHHSDLPHMSDNAQRVSDIGFHARPEPSGCADLPDP